MSFNVEDSSSSGAPPSPSKKLQRAASIHVSVRRVGDAAKREYVRNVLSHPIGTPNSPLQHVCAPVASFSPQLRSEIDVKLLTQYLQNNRCAARAVAWGVALVAFTRLVLLPNRFAKQLDGAQQDILARRLRLRTLKPREVRVLTLLQPLLQRVITTLLSVPPDCHPSTRQCGRRWSVLHHSVRQYRRLRGKE